MLFSVQKINLTYSLEFLPEMMTIKVSSQSLGFFFGSIWCLNSIVSHDRHHEERLQGISPDADSDHSKSVCNDWNDITDFRTSYNGLSLGSQLQICGSTCNRSLLSLRTGRICGEPNYIRRGWKVLWTPVSEPPRQPPAMEAKPAMRSIENLQNSSAARQLFDL